MIAKLIRIIIPLAVIGLGVILWQYLKSPSEEDTTDHESANFKNIKPSFSSIRRSQKQNGDAGFPVDVMPLLLTSYQVLISSRGETVAGEQTDLINETEGKVITLSDTFEVGSFVKEGSVLVQLDQEDLEADVNIAVARVAQAEASLAQEKARAKQALLNWEDIGFDEAPGDLVLRKPQLKQAEASLKAAKAQVDKAKRELLRSVTVAPYDGIISERSISLGQQVNKGKKIGSIIGTDNMDISLPVSAKMEAFLPSSPSGAKVTFRNPLRPDDSPAWHGFLTNREPVVDQNTKQPHFRASITDPYALQSPSPTPLSVGQPVTAKIEGQRLENVYIVPKSALRSPNSIHITNAEMILEELVISPLITDDENIIFQADLSEGSYWIKSLVRSGGVGMKLQIKTEESTEKGNITQ